ncbi:MAG: hypothetical protein E7581_03510 [Ruminococcaceae bacterium]|nr:hypothetical protein [Oscillospiraceae bacterium]
MEFITVFIKYALIHYSIGLLAFLSQDGNAVADLPPWIAVNIIVNMAVLIFSARGFRKFVFKSERFLPTERKWLGILCGFGISLVYLFLTFVIARLV